MLKKNLKIKSLSFCMHQYMSSLLYIIEISCNFINIEDNSKWVVYISYFTQAFCVCSTVYFVPSIFLYFIWLLFYTYALYVVMIYFLSEGGHKHLACKNRLVKIAPFYVGHYSVTALFKMISPLLDNSPDVESRACHTINEKLML